VRVAEGGPNRPGEARRGSVPSAFEVPRHRLRGFARGLRQRPTRPASPAVGRDDRGVATVFVCVGAVLVMAVTALAIHLGAAVLARQRAETAADLAALAGAARVLRGPDLVCAGVVRVASANDARVDSCVVQGTDVLVSVVARVQAGPISGTVSARARAGPVQRITDGR
jgi:secretion/DNA translocation related TadE-like protein